MKKLILICMFFPVLLMAQISPGDLSKFHKDLEGLSKCTKCHVLGEKVTNAKCLDCHEKVDDLIKNKRGFHASAEASGKSCESCHPEHFGRDFDIIKFDEDKFDHNKAGFELTGKHAKLKCNKCHRAEFIKDTDLKKREKTFIGLPTDCKSCHEDFHQGTLKDDCASCHNTEAFRPAPKFNHDDAKFKLTGKHKNVDCEKCHRKSSRNNKVYQQFKGVKFSSCQDCHKDVHNGNFGANCSSCHVTSSFKQIRNQKNFNHDKTNFPLRGKHKKVKCAKCHGNNFSRKMRYAKCMDCHEDYHKGEISKIDGKAQDCSVCHSVDGFKEAQFGISEHMKINFKLEGSHLAVPCNKCHLKNNNWKFDFNSLKCIECHENEHKKFMSAKFLTNDCEQCHVVNSWEQIKEFDHSRTKFDLIGKHKGVKCGVCHIDKSGDKHIQKFSKLSMDCETCHKDVHFSQFAQDGKTDCSTCHTPENWNASKFNHETTRFSLTGAHAKVECSGCHKVVTVNNKRYVKFKIEDIRCESCHS